MPVDCLLFDPLFLFNFSNFQIFVTVATGVGLRQISLTQLNLPTPKGENPLLGAIIGGVSSIQTEL